MNYTCNKKGSIILVSRKFDTKVIETLPHKECLFLPPLNVKILMISDITGKVFLPNPISRRIGTISPGLGLNLNTNLYPPTVPFV